MCPGRFVCPEAQCKTSNAQEKKLANHIIAQHGNTEYVQKAKDDLVRIKAEKEEEKKNRDKNKKKGRKKRIRQDIKRKWMT